MRRLLDGRLAAAGARRPRRGLAHGNRSIRRLRPRRLGRRIGTHVGTHARALRRTVNGRLAELLEHAEATLSSTGEAVPASTQRVCYLPSNDGNDRTLLLAEARDTIDARRRLTEDEAVRLHTWISDLLPSPASSDQR